jgi:glycosyltransferase involved in cell wall biosynthesis
MKSYIASGVPSDLVKVVPNGVNTAIFSPQAKPWPIPTAKRFKFLFVGGLIWRKGLDVLLQAYQLAFSKADDVTLVIKEIGKSNFYQGMGSYSPVREMQEDPCAPEVIHITQMLTEEQMAGLFTACDCLVHPYRGEGFALPVLEAMACGLPVAVTEGGATDDFCSRDTAFLIPAELRGFFHNKIKFAGGPGWVLEPDPAALAEILRHVRWHREEAAAKALLALDQARTQYCWGAVAKHVFARIDALLSKPIRRSGRCGA